jgi:hypothetical protein
MITGGGKKAGNALMRFSIKNQDDDGGDKTYGSFVSQIDFLIDNNQKEFPLYNNKGKDTGMVLKFKELLKKEQPSFAEYLKSGWFINMSLAIDYTASNGDVKNPKSLHFINEDSEKMNEYETAMSAVGKILNTYAYKHKFMAYGFGGIPKDSKDGKVSHCFPLNGNEKDPSIDGLDKLMKTYRDSLSEVKLYGPTLFEDVHKKVLSFVKDKMELTTVQLYHVLLILTDGCIHDMRSTID